MAAINTSNLTERCRSELEILVAIYGHELSFSAPNSLKISIKIGPEAFEPLCLQISLGDRYPDTMPSYSFASLHHGKWLTSEREKNLVSSLKGLYDPQSGDNVMIAIEWIRENAFSEMNLTENDLMGPNQTKDKQNARGSLASGQSVYNFPVPTIYHSHRITDRKSKFQAHFSRCWSEEEVQAVIDLVRNDSKCSQAVHPCIYAWRLESNTPGDVMIGSSDDGEGGAAAFLENLLQTRNISNGVLMVTRWFGGTLLGPDRFRHITNISEILLNQVFDQSFIEKPHDSSKANSASSSSFSLLSSASACMKFLQETEKEYHMVFTTPHSLEKSSPVKSAFYASHRSQFPIHRLSTIKRPDGTELWTNYSPAHISLTQNSR
jgi:hypothetical protein